jgi:hypothetical protein
MLDNCIIQIISKYLKCKKKDCNLHGFNMLEYWRFDKGYYCTRCYNLYQTEMEIDYWTFHDDHGIGL